MISAEQDHLLKRLTDHRADEELDRALDRLRKNFYQLYQPVQEYWEDPFRAEEWWKAEKHSQEWRKMILLEEALKVLDVALYG